MTLSKVQSISKTVEEYDALRARKKTIDDRMKVLAEEIKNYASLHGVKDDKGSFYTENPNYTFGSQCKKSISLNPDRVLEYFKANRLNNYIKTKEYVSDEDVERLSSDGKIPFEDLEKLCDTKTSYSVIVKKKEEVSAEVEEHNVPVAASKKPKLKLNKR